MEIYRYETQDLLLEVKSGSTLTDADHTPTARIVSPEPPDAPIDRVPTVTKVTTGVYKVPLLVSDVTEERTLEVRWSYEIGGVAVEQSTFSDVVVPYSTTAELAAVAPAGTTEAQLKEASAFAKALIDGTTNQSFGKHYRELSIPGTDKPVVTFPEQVLSVLTLADGEEMLYDHESTSNYVTVTITPTGHAISIDQNDGLDFEDNTFTTRDGRRFYSDTTYTVTGYFGWEYVPYDIKMAHRLLVNDWFCGDSIWKKRYIEQQRANGWDVKFDSRVYTETGNFFVDQLLRPYIRQPLVVF